MSQGYIRPFPLYDHLQEKSKGKILLRDVIIPSLSASLGRLEPKAGDQVLFFLIHFYFLTNPGATFDSPKKALPFGIKLSPGGRGVSFDLKSLPDQMIGILAEYVGLTKEEVQQD